MQTSPWAHLHDKYANPNRPHRVLAIDGGGVRGLISLQILRELETYLREQLQRPNLVLGDWFDMIGGTSTGAVISATLSRGLSVADVEKFYLDCADEMFTKNALLERVAAKYDEVPLRQKLQDVLGSESTLSLKSTKAWRCLFMGVTTNWNTLSPWPITNNPLAKYNNEDRPDCNLNVPLWQVVRASTAAPAYFRPEVVQWDDTDPKKRFVFVDGGISPYNNPAFNMYRVCTAEPYKLCWPQGEQNLLVMSIGTGLELSRRHRARERGDFIWTHAWNIPGTLMDIVSVEQDLNCRTVGRCLHGQPIDREVGDMIPRRDGKKIPVSENLGRAFSYMRFNADVSEEGLHALGLSNIDPKQVAKLDSLDGLEELKKIGTVVARDVRPAMEKARGFITV